MFGDTIKDMKIFFKIMFSKPWSYKLLVITWIFVFFGMWDNFVTTFLLDYIDDIMSTSKEVAKFDKFNLLTAYVVIAIFCIPSYWLQVPFVKFAEKWWSWKIMMPWLLFAWISMFIFGLSKDLWFNFVLLAGLLNGIWYAACSPTSQWEFTNEYNQIYADKNNLKQIDANASSAPNKMLANIANVIWLWAGWVFLQIFQYTVSFFLLWFLLLWLLVISMIKRKEWKLY
jgi:hypothetical protein